MEERRDMGTIDALNISWFYFFKLLIHPVDSTTVRITFFFEFDRFSNKNRKTKNIFFSFGNFAIWNSIDSM